MFGAPAAFRGCRKFEEVVNCQSLFSTNIFKTRDILSADNTETGLPACGKSEAVHTYIHNIQVIVEALDR